MTTEPPLRHTIYINVPEAVGVFGSFEGLQSAIHDMRMAGFSRTDFRLPDGKSAMTEMLGQPIGMPTIWRTIMMRRVRPAYPKRRSGKGFF